MWSLINAFVIHLMESIISRYATSKISIFSLVSVAEQAGLNLTLFEAPKTAFVPSRPNSIRHPCFHLKTLFALYAKRDQDQTRPV